MTPRLDASSLHPSALVGEGAGRGGWLVFARNKPRSVAEWRRLVRRGADSQAAYPVREARGGCARAGIICIRETGVCV